MITEGRLLKYARLEMKSIGPAKRALAELFNKNKSKILNAGGDAVSSAAKKKINVKELIRSIQESNIGSGLKKKTVSQMQSLASVYVDILAYVHR